MLHTHLVIGEGLGFERRHVDLLVALALLAEGPVWQLASLVGHEVAALGEGQVLQVQQLTGSHRLAGGAEATNQPSINQSINHHGGPLHQLAMTDPHPPHWIPDI